MSSVIHGTFTVPADLNAPPQRVAEVSSGAFAPTGEREERLDYRAVFHDIVPDERVVFSYHLTVDDVRRWASLVTIELAPARGRAGRFSPARQAAASRRAAACAPGAWRPRPSA